MTGQLFVQGRFAFADGCAARRENEPAYAGHTTCLKVIERSDDVGDAIRSRVGDRRSDARVARKMYNHIATSRGTKCLRFVADVPFDQLDLVSFWADSCGKVGACSDRKIVENANAMSAIRE